MRGRGGAFRWVVATLALVLLALVAGEAAGWPPLRGVTQRAATQLAKVPVLINGRFHMRLLVRPGIEAQSLRIGAGGGLPLPHLLEGRDVRISWTWPDLWRWWRGAPLRVQAMSAGALDLNLVRASDGRASWHLGERAEPARQGAAADDLPHVGMLTLHAGRVHVADAPRGTQLQITVEGGEGPGRTAAAGYRFGLEGRWREMPLALHGHTGGALPLLNDPPDDAQQPAIALQVQGEAGTMRLAFEGQASALAGNRRLDGALAIESPSLAALGRAGGLTLPQTPPLLLRTRLRHDNGVWLLDGAQAEIGRSRIGGSFRFDTTVAPRYLSGRLEGPRLLLADLGPAVGMPPKRAATTSAAQLTPRRVLPQRRFDLPSLLAMDADVQVAIDELDLGTPAIASLGALRTQLRLHDGLLELRSLQGNTAAGRVSGWTSLDGRATPARWGARLRLENIDAARWLLVTRGYLTGRLDADLDLTGAGVSTADILGSLDGRALVKLREGTLSHLATELIGLDVAQALGVALRGDRSLPLRCASFDLKVRDGVVSPRRAVLDNRDSTLRVGGQVDLGDETLALALRSKPKDFSPLSLRSPVTLTGTFAAPRLGVDNRRLAGRMVGALLLGAVVGPVAALLPLVEPGEGEGPDPCARGGR